MVKQTARLETTYEIREEETHCPAAALAGFAA
jgi:hypothetical protein